MQGGSALVSLLKNPLCSLKVLVLGDCHLGLLGILLILQALPDCCSLEELNLSANVDFDKHHTPVYDSTVAESPKSAQTNKDISKSSFKTDCDQLEAADSEDDQNRIKPAVSGPSDSCMSSCHRNAYNQEIELVQDLSTAIGLAKHLKLLDLSMNGFSLETAAMLYAAWSKSSRAGLAQRHIQDKIVHLSVLGRKCCGVKSCCRRD